MGFTYRIKILRTLVTPVVTSTPYSSYLSVHKLTSRASTLDCTHLGQEIILYAVTALALR